MSSWWIYRGSITGVDLASARLRRVTDVPLKRTIHSRTIWYMNTDCSIDIDAPSDVVWGVFIDIERWAEWTASIDRIVALDGPGLEVGKRFEIKQPRFPKLVWQVTEVAPGRSWTWTQRSFGGTTAASHEVVAVDAGRTLVRQTIDQRGPIGALLGRMMRGMTRRYLGMEAHGLKVRSEQIHRSAPPA